MATVQVLDALVYPLEGYVDYAILIVPEKGEILVDPNTKAQTDEVRDRVRANGTDADFQAAARKLVLSYLTPADLPNEVEAGASYTFTAADAQAPA